MNRVMFGLGLMAALALASGASAAQKEESQKNGKKVVAATTVNINTASFYPSSSGIVSTERKMITNRTSALH